MRLGIDVGGTNTDAVVIDERDEVLAKEKTPTTPDVTEGIKNSMKGVLSEIDREKVNHVMVGTTHCTNAIAERKGLAETAVIRIGAPATISIDPLFEWPQDLRQAIGDHTVVVEGGHEFNGEEISEFDEEGIEEFLSEIEGKVESVSITSVFSPVNPEHEESGKKVAKETLGDVPVSLSHEIGSIGLLERENATALNASLSNVIERTSKSIEEALDDLKVDARVYFCQNDGTLMSLEYAKNYPILTMASGPSNSIKGAALLSEIEDGIVVDIGGTTTDIGVLSKGFPRESSTPVDIGKIKTNFRMPDLISVGIGGGSLINETKGLRVGPRSVGHELTEKSLCFGGTVSTATDAAVKLGMSEMGEVEPEMDEETARRSIDWIEEKLSQGIDEIKTEAGKVPVGLVGGGSILASKLKGASHIVKPEHFEVANAIGAAISQVSGQIDRIFSMEGREKNDVIREAKDSAKKRAIEAGADSETLEVVDFEEIPLAYLPGDAIRVKVKVAGDLMLK